MRFKDLKLGIKLSIGFGLLIAISCILGGIAIYNMKNVSNESHILADEYVPEVQITTDLRGAVNRLMYQMRGYSYTQNKEQLSLAQEELSIVDQHIKEAKELSNKAKNLLKLQGQIETAEKARNKYAGLIDETVSGDKVIAETRLSMDISAMDYMSSCNAYLTNQNNAMEREIRERKTQQGRLEKITLINDVIDLGNDTRVKAFKFQALRDDSYLNDALKNFPEIYNKFDELRKRTYLQVDIAELNQVEKAAKVYESDLRNLKAAWANLQEIGIEREAAGQQLVEACKITAAAGLNGTTRIAANAVTLLESSNKVMVIGLSLAILIGILMAIWLTRMITVPIVKGVELSRKMAEGDLTASIDVNQRDEVGVLASALKEMAAKLKEVVGTVKANSENIAAASEQMSESATEQASSAEEVSSSMEEMASNIQQNNDNAQQTESIAKKAATDIEEGSQAVEITVKSMKEIAEKISIIGEIAEKTDLLAINAAIEAARAGEHGKGFAVVAVEVRKLAERSQVAAAEIDRVSKESVKVAERTGTIMTEIVPDIQKTARLVQEISAASLEQNSGVDQINNAVQQLNQINRPKQTQKRLQ